MRSRSVFRSDQDTTRARGIWTALFPRDYGRPLAPREAASRGARGLPCTRGALVSHRRKGILGLHSQGASCLGEQEQTEGLSLLRRKVLPAKTALPWLWGAEWLAEPGTVAPRPPLHHSRVTRTAGY